MLYGDAASPTAPDLSPSTFDAVGDVKASGTLLSNELDGSQVGDSSQKVA